MKKIFATIAAGILITSCGIALDPSGQPVIVAIPSNTPSYQQPVQNHNFTKVYSNVYLRPDRNYMLDIALTGDATVMYGNSPYIEVHYSSNTLPPFEISAVDPSRPDMAGDVYLSAPGNYNYGRVTIVVPRNVVLNDVQVRGTVNNQIAKF